MDDGMDYEVQTKVRCWLDFDGSGDFNMMLLPDIQELSRNKMYHFKPRIM